MFISTFIFLTGLKIVSCNFDTQGNRYWGTWEIYFLLINPVLFHLYPLRIVLWLYCKYLLVWENLIALKLITVQQLTLHTFKSRTLFTYWTLVCDYGEMGNTIKLSLVSKHQNIEVYKGRSRQKTTERKLIQQEPNIKEISISNIH
jgi:hypothetical protein